MSKSELGAGSISAEESLKLPWTGSINNLAVKHRAWYLEGFSWHQHKAAASCPVTNFTVKCWNTALSSKKACRLLFACKLLPFTCELQQVMALPDGIIGVGPSSLLKATGIHTCRTVVHSDFPHHPLGNNYFNNGLQRKETPVYPVII